MRNSSKIDIRDSANPKFEACCTGLGNNEKIEERYKQTEMTTNGFIDVHLSFSCVVLYIS